MLLKTTLIFLSLSVISLPTFGYDLKIISTDHHHYQTPGTYDSKMSFQNVGTTNIQFFQLKWSLNDVILDSLEIDILDTWNYTLQPSNSVSSSFFPLTIQQSLPLLIEGEYNFKIWINTVHGSQDLDLSNDTIGYMIHVVDYLPIKHVLLEKYSHTYCGPCYDGDLSVIDLLTNYDNLSVVAVHNASNDPFSFPDGTILDNFFADAHPEFVFDRYLYPPNPGFGSMVWNGNSNDLNKRKNNQEGLEVNIIHQTYDYVTRDLTVTLEADFYANYYDTIAFNLYVLEDSLIGYQAGAPDPNNYYHMHVARSILGGPFGTTITAPTLDGNTLEYTFNYNLPSNFNENNIHVLGFIQRKNGAVIDVVNSTDEIKIQEEYSYLDELTKVTLNVYPNPFENELNIESDFPIFGVYLYNMTGNVIMEGTTNKIDISNLSNGIFQLKVITSQGAFFRLVEKL